LWKKLRNNDWNIDFIGTQIDTELYPMVNDEEFDPHHEGHSGWTSGQLLDELSDWTAVLDTPDIVLFSSPGGNDALDGFSYESIMVNVVDIVEGLQEFNPEITIIIEKMAPGHSVVMMGNLAVFHARLLNELDSIASALSTSTSQVLTIDMATGFTDDMLADPIHYNQDGATFIANKYYDALTPLLEE
jgi:lysophospholipase L1-like esterase